MVVGGVTYTEKKAVLLGKRLLNLYLCAGKLGFVGGQIVLGGFQVIIKVTE